MNASFVHLSMFVADWRHLRLTDDDLRALEKILINRPVAGDVMAGTGGLRKLRFAPPSRGGGKSGGLRVCYAVFPTLGLIILYAAYAKNEKANMSPADRNTCNRILQRLRASFDHRGGER